MGVCCLSNFDKRNECPSLSFYSVCSDKLLGIHTLTDVTDRAAIYMPRGFSAANAEEL